MNPLRALLVGLAAAWLTPAEFNAQQRDSSLQHDTIQAPGPQYRAGGWRPLLLGKEYRSLWATPVTVPVLDLRTFAGGLRPISKGGGQQTKSLRLAATDGREFFFRSVDKDPAAVLPPELRGNVA